MTDILVNKGDLKNAKDIIDKLLKSGKESASTHTQSASYEREELSVRLKKIIKYVVKLYGVQTGLNPQQIIDFLLVYGGLGLGAFAEHVLDILWKICYPMLPLVDQLYASEDREKLKDWRNIISENDYVPKTTQGKNLGKLLP